MDSRFHWADYLVFGLSLMLSTCIGLWFACTGKKASTTEEFLMAGRNMPVFPVSVSMFVSWVSAISFLGDPVETYTYGSIYIFLGIGYVLACPIVAYFFAPRFHDLGLISIYEFLESKYNKVIRVFAAIICIAVTESWLAIVLYAPALAFSQVSGIPVWASIVAIGLVCTFYTAIGGMKAVLWADTVQMLIMVAGQLAVVIQGSIKMGGMGNIMRIAEEGGRLNFVNFDPNPLLRASFWTGLIGGFFRVLNPYVSTQFLTQRYCTVSTPRRASLIAYTNIPMFILLPTLFWLIGLVMYAMYHDCDPLNDGQIISRDQMVPLSVINLLSFMPGIPGLFLACVFSASLSSLSSGYNGSSAVVLKDMITPLYYKYTHRLMSDKLQTNTTKALAVFFGFLTIGLAFLIMFVGTSIFEMTSKVTGMFGGPMAALFVCGLFLPKLRNFSVMTSFVITIVIAVWYAIGTIFYKPNWSALPFSTKGCDVLDPNATLLEANSSLLFAGTTMGSILNDSTSGLSSHFSHNGTDNSYSSTDFMSNLYSLNPLYFGPFTTVFCILLALIIDLIFTAFKMTCCRDRYAKFRIQTKESMMVTYAYEKPESLRGDPRRGNRRPSRQSEKADLIRTSVFNRN